MYRDMPNNIVLKKNIIAGIVVLATLVLIVVYYAGQKEPEVIDIDPYLKHVNQDSNQHDFRDLLNENKNKKWPFETDKVKTKQQNAMFYGWPKFEISDIPSKVGIKLKGSSRFRRLFNFSLKLLCISKYYILMNLY